MAVRQKLPSTKDGLRVRTMRYLTEPRSASCNERVLRTCTAFQKKIALEITRLSCLDQMLVLASRRSDKS